MQELASQNVKIILDRIKERYGLKTDTQLSELLGVGQSTVSTWKMRGTLDYELIIAKCSDIDLDWLFKGTESEKQLIVEEPKGLYVVSLKKQIPLVSIEAVAGMGSADFAIKVEDIQEHYVIPDFKKIDFMVRVKGSSMYPKYNSGDIVACLVLKEHTFIQWNKVHLIATRDQGILIKRLRKGSDIDRITAISDNKDYDPFEVPWKDITGVALVVGVVRLE